MRIKSADRHTSYLRAAASYYRNTPKRWRLIAACAVLLFGAGTVTGYLIPNGTARRALTALTTVEQRVRGWFADPERMTIDIAHTDFMTLARKQDLAVQRGVLVSSEDDYVPATIRYRERTIPAKLRLKGDLTDHLGDDKWSFRVILRDDNTLFGMKRFSLQHPRVRAYLYEYVCHRAMEREDVLALRYRFVEVTINGRPNGIYALEEHFGTRLVERQRRRAGPIVRFDESVFWAELARQQRVPVWERRLQSGAGSFGSSGVDAFQTSRWMSDPASFEQYVAAVHLLEGFQQGRLSAGEVFDVALMARFLALTDLLGAWHGAGVWTNLRLYYNPVTARLEPVAFDGYDERVPGPEPLLGVRPLRAEFGGDTGHLSLLFSDRGLYARYVQELERVSDPAYLEALIAELQPEIDEQLLTLYREYPELTFSWAPLRTHHAALAIALAPSKALHAFERERPDGSLVIDVANVQELPVEVIGATYGDSLDLTVAADVLLPGKGDDDPLRYTALRLSVPSGFEWPEPLAEPIRVRYRLLGASTVQAVDVFPWPHEVEGSVAADLMRQEPNAGSFEFLDVDEERRQIALRPGSWRLERPLIVPPGYRLIAGPGTELDLTGGACVISYSPLQFVGDPDDPVRITSKDSLGQGLAVIRAGGESLLENVVFENLTNPHTKLWALTGCVTFYEAPVRLLGCRFVSSRAEDALNLIRGEFSLEDVRFEDTASDAIDVDFGTGVIRRSGFVSTGNDAIDVSGSTVELEGISIAGAGDKGVSAGENSVVRGSEVAIRDAFVGVAAKDLSRIILRDVRITGGDVGVAAYQKKSEFGPADIELKGLVLEGTTTPYLVERGSTLTVDGSVVESEASNVVDTLYPPEPGSRR